MNLIQVNCWCERSVVSVNSEHLKLGLTRPCKVRECLAMAVKKLHNPGGRDVLMDRYVVANFRRAGYDLKSLGLDKR
jgi:hypothetical protein